MNHHIATAAVALGLLTSAAADPPRVDRHGDPLPAGAVVRLGSSRWRGVVGPTGETQIRFAADGRAIVCRMPDGSAAWLDVDTGRELRRVRGPASFQVFVLTADGKSLITMDEP